MSKSLKNIGIVAAATVVSRVLGLAREVVIAAVFGTSALASAFVSAFTLPNLFRRLLGEGALTAAFVPALAAELERGRREGAFALLSKVATRLAVVTTLLSGAGMLLFANAAAVVAACERLGLGAETGQRLLLGADLAVVLFPYVALVCLAAAFSAACQVLGRFAEPALSPVWLNLAMLGALAAGAWWALGAPERMRWLCAGVLVGGFFQMAVPGGVLVRLGWRPRFDLHGDERVGEIARLMVPTLLGSAIYLINIAVSRLVGLSLNDHAVSVLNLANRVMELPIGVFAAAVATVVFPLIAGHAARGDWTRLGEDYHKGLRLVLMLNVPAAAGLAVLSEPITRVLFQRGAFGPEDTVMMTPILAVYACGLPFLAFTSLALRGFYAIKDTATPVRAAAVSFAVNLVLSILLMRWLSTVGLALAGNLAVLAQAWFLQTRLARRRPELRLHAAWAGFGKILAASLAIGALAWMSWRCINFIDASQRTRDLAALGLILPAACGVYAALLWGLRIEGREEVAALVRRARAKLAGR